MPAKIELAPDEFRRQMFDRLRVKFNPMLPANTVMVLGHFSASLIVDGKVHVFEWDEQRFYPHGITLIGLREVPAKDGV